MPAERAGWRYLLRRCWAEGLSKAHVSALAGRSAALASERNYATRTLPRAVAQSFGFPLALMLAVLIFLLIQSRMDERDPKLRRAPLTAAETTIPFLDEADV